MDRRDRRPELLVSPPTGSAEARQWPVVEVRRLEDGRTGLFHLDVSTYEYVCPYKVLKTSWFGYDITREADQRHA